LLVVHIQNLLELAELYTKQGQYERAIPLYEKVIEIWEDKLGKDHPDLVTALDSYHACRRGHARGPAAQGTFFIYSEEGERAQHEHEEEDEEADAGRGLA
jgi:tetratricopeptide (TPR) repeat protein